MVLLGVGVLILFFLVLTSGASACEIFFLLPALLTLPLNFEDPVAAVIFSKSSCLIRSSLMEADNLSPALLPGLYMSSG